MEIVKNHRQPRAIRRFVRRVAWTVYLRSLAAWVMITAALMGAALLYLYHVQGMDEVVGIPIRWPGLGLFASGLVFAVLLYGRFRETVDGIMQRLIQGDQRVVDELLSPEYLQGLSPEKLDRLIEVCAAVHLGSNAEAQERENFRP